MDRPRPPRSTPKASSSSSEWRMRRALFTPLNEEVPLNPLWTRTHDGVLVNLNNCTHIRLVDPKEGENRDYETRAHRTDTLYWVLQRFREKGEANQYMNNLLKKLGADY